MIQHIYIVYGQPTYLGEADSCAVLARNKEEAKELAETKIELPAYEHIEEIDIHRSGVILTNLMEDSND